MTDGRLRATLTLFAALGLALASYLSWARHAGIAPACGGGGCERVQTSAFAEVAGIPVAVLGMVGYAAILASAWIPAERGRTSSALLAQIGFGYSAYLTYRELFTLDAVCSWCLLSATLMTILAGLATWRLVAHSSPAHPMDES